MALNSSNLARQPFLKSAGGMELASADWGGAWEQSWRAGAGYARGGLLRWASEGPGLGMGASATA